MTTSLRDNLGLVLAGYEEARKTGTFGRKHELWGVFDTLKRDYAESSAVMGRLTVRVVWSVGKGNWAKVPWISFLDTRETDTTRRGVYCVYLFRQDMSGVYLAFQQGVTEEKERYGRLEAHRRLSEKAADLRSICGPLAERHFRLDDEIDLRADPGLGTDYESSTVAYKFYEADALPDDENLLEDLEAVLRTYDRYLADEKRVDPQPALDKLRLWLSALRTQRSPDGRFHYKPLLLMAVLNILDGDSSHANRFGYAELRDEFMRLVAEAGSEPVEKRFSQPYLRMNNDVEPAPLWILHTSSTDKRDDGKAARPSYVRAFAPSASIHPALWPAFSVSEARAVVRREILERWPVGGSAKGRSWFDPLPYPPVLEARLQQLFKDSGHPHQDLLAAIFRRAVYLHQKVGTDGYLVSQPEDPKRLYITVGDLDGCFVGRTKMGLLVIDDPLVRERYPDAMAPKSIRGELLVVSESRLDPSALRRVLEDAVLWAGYEGMLAKMISFPTARPNHNNHKKLNVVTGERLDGQRLLGGARSGYSVDTQGGRTGGIRVSERLASIGEVIPLTPEEVLSEAEAFLAQKNYRLERRTGTLVTMERARSKGFLGWDKELVAVTVEAEPQPEGGVLVSVSGTDREGVLERRDEWNEWAGRLRAKAAERQGEARAAQEPPGATEDRSVNRDESAGSSGDGPAGELDLASRYYKPGRAAILLGKDAYEINLMIHRKELPMTRIRGRRWIPKEAVDELVREASQPASQDSASPASEPAAATPEDPVSGTRDPGLQSAEEAEESEGGAADAAQDPSGQTRGETDESPEAADKVWDLQWRLAMLEDELRAEKEEHERDNRAGEFEIARLEAELDNLRTGAGGQAEDLRSELEEERSLRAEGEQDLSELRAELDAERAQRMLLEEASEGSEDDARAALEEEIRVLRGELEAGRSRGQQQEGRLVDLMMKLEESDADRRKAEEMLSAEREKALRFENEARLLAEVRKVLGEANGSFAPPSTEQRVGEENQRDEGYLLETPTGSHRLRSPFFLEERDLQLLRLLAKHEELTAAQLQHRTGRRRAPGDLDKLMDRFDEHDMAPIEKVGDRYSFDTTALQSDAS